MFDLSWSDFSLIMYAYVKVNEIVFDFKQKQGLCFVCRTVYILYCYVLYAHLVWYTTNLLPKLCDPCLKQLCVHFSLLSTLFSFIHALWRTRYNGLIALHDRFWVLFYFYYCHKYKCCIKILGTMYTGCLYV